MNATNRAEAEAMPADEDFFSDYLFWSCDAAATSLAAATLDWTTTEEIPTPATKGPTEIAIVEGEFVPRSQTGIWVVMSDDGEYAVANDHQGGNRWCCIA